MSAVALIVTGKQEQARILRQALTAAGFQPECVSTGARAQVQLAFSTPDLIVLDIDLPDMPGEVILRQINAHRRLDTSVLFLISSDGRFGIETGRLLTFIYRP